ncbi:MAG: SigE family RNA polymerase sigma factor [Dermatophilaceae bacterium]
MTTTAQDTSPLDLDRLYAEQWAPLVRLGALLVDDVGAAEDVVQDAFVSLYRRQGSLRNGYAASAYLRSAVVNGCRSALRHRGVVRRTLHLVATPSDGADRAHFEAVTDDAQLMSALRQLPQQMREVLVLRHWGALSEAEIAESLGIPAGTVKSTSSRALSRLREILGGQS